VFKPLSTCDDAWKGLERYGKSIDSATPRRLGTGLLVVSKPEANDEAKGLELEGAWIGQNSVERTNHSILQLVLIIVASFMKIARKHGTNGKY